MSSMILLLSAEYTRIISVLMFFRVSMIRADFVALIYLYIYLFFSDVCH